MISVAHPNGALSLPVGEVYLKYNDGTYQSIMFCDSVGNDELMWIKKFIIENGIEDEIQSAIFVDRTAGRYYSLYPVLCHYYYDLKYIEYQLEERRHKY